MSKSLNPPGCRKFSITYLASESEARKRISEAKLNGAVVLGSDEIRLILDGTSPQIANAITSAVSSGMRAAATQVLSILPIKSPLPAVTTYYIYGYDLETKDALGSALLGVSIFFLTFLNTAIAFLRERLQGTLEKVISSPLSRAELVSGYILGFCFVSIAQAAVTFVVLVVGFRVPMQGSLLAVHSIISPNNALRGLVSTSIRAGLAEAHLLHRDLLHGETFMLKKEIA